MSLANLRAPWRASIRRGFTWWALLALASAPGCRRETSTPNAPAEKPAAEHPHSDEPAHEALPKRVRLAAEVIQAAGIRTAPVTREVLAVTVALPGEINADPDRTARVASPVAGRLETVSFREGSAVKKGDVLATIRVPDLGKLRSLTAATQAKAKAARANADRLKALADQRLASEQTYLDAEATAQAFEVEALAAGQQQAALGLGAGGGSPSELTLRAPLAGVVVTRNAVVGQPLNPEEVIADIVDLSEVWFLGRAFEKDLGKLRVNADSEVQLNAYPQQVFSGQLEYIGRQVDPVARTVTARIRLENRDDLLRVGLFGTAYVAVGGTRDAMATLVVPRSAVTEIAGKPAVFVREADNDFELHELQLGDDAAGRVQVLSGLREGEDVVVEGVFSLKSALLKHTFAEDE